MSWMMEKRQYVLETVEDVEACRRELLLIKDKFAGYVAAGSPGWRRFAEAAADALERVYADEIRTRASAR